MATFTINTKNEGQLEFSVKENDHGYAAYVFVNGRQPCDGGGHMGSTLMATPATLEKVARRWLRQRRATQKEFE